MKRNHSTILLTTLTLFLILAVFSTSFAEENTSVTLQQGENGTVLVSETAAKEPPHIFEGFIKERAETLGLSFDDWPLKDKADFSEWCQEQGIPQETWVHGIPSEDNMVVEDAVQMAWDAVIAKYDIKETVLSEKFKVQITFNVIDRDNPVWEIEYRVKDGVDVNVFGYYRVNIDDQMEEVIGIYSIADAHG